MPAEVKVRRRRGTTRLSSKNQVTAPGVLRLTRADDPLEELIGSDPGLSGRTDLQALRDKWDR